MPLSKPCKPILYLLLFCLLIASLFLANTANATIYYVAISGNDSNPGTITQPFRTIREGIKAVSSGDTLYIKSGTYTESISSNVQTIPTGTSWSNAPVIAAFSGDTVILQPFGNNSGEVMALAHSYIQYVIFDGLILDAVNKEFAIATTNGAHHVRFQNMEIKNAHHSGALLTPGSQPVPHNTYHEFINCNIHHNGNNHTDHGLYITTSRNLIKQSRIHQNASFGVHVFGSTGETPSNNMVIENKVYNNAVNSASASGILLSSGDSNMAYNNIVYGNKNGIQVHNNNPTNSKIYNNTVYNNGPSGYGIDITSLSSGAIVKNNVVYANATPIVNQGINTALSNNLVTNPNFVNQSNGDFHLQAGSPAIDTGITISGISTDHDGNARPQGSTFDIGAYEFLSGSGGGTATFPAPMSTPAPGSTLTSTSVTFTGGHTSQDTNHWLHVGTSIGATNLHNSGAMGSGHTATVSGLPTSGTIYVRYWSTNVSGGNSGYVYQDHTYTMAVGGSGGGTATFPAPMSTPAPGSTLTSTSVTFTGGHTSQDTNHWLYVGTSIGATNLHNSGAMGSGHTATVSGLPTSGTIYVRYWSTNVSGGNSGYVYQDHTYTMAVGGSGGGSGGGGTFPPAMTSPAPGSTLTSTSMTFTGGHTSADVLHALWVGTSPGSTNLYQGGITNHSQTVTGLPSSGTIYVRYWSNNSSNGGAGWAFQDHTYTMALGGSGGGSGGGGTATFPAPVSTPAPGSILTSTSVTFTGAHTTADVLHALWVGTSPGSTNLYQGGITNHSQTVTGLPNSGTIYVRYWSNNSSNGGAGWAFQDHTYTMAVGGSGGGTATFPAPMSTPAPGSVLTSTSVTFTGGHTSQDLEHWLSVGTSVGGQTFHHQSLGTGHTATVSGLPTSGTLHVRYWTTSSSSGWVFQDHTYTMSAAGN